MEYIFGRNTIESFLDTNLLVEVFILPNFKDEKLLKAFREKKIKTSIKDKSFLDKITNSGNHQGVVGAISSYSYSSLDDIINNVKGKYPFIVVLDGIEDPHNLGAIIRTCEVFNVDGIIVSKHNSCPLNATVAKVSTGAIANVKIAQVTNLTQTLKMLKDKGYWVYVAEAFNAKYYNEADYNNPTVLVLGSEGFGVSRLVKEQADFNIAIKQYGKVNSLNVSVATGILISYISLMQKS